MKISFQNLSFSYQNRLGISRRVISGLTLDITWDGNKAIAGMLLPYGGGKSSLLRIAAGLLTPDSGSCVVTDDNGNPVKVVYIPPVPCSLSWLSFDEQVRLVLPDLTDQSKVKQAAEICGLEGYETHLPSEKSASFRLRVQIALALLSGAGVILLDDPFTMLPAESKDHLFRDLRELTSRTGAALFFATSGLGDAAQLTDTLYIFSSLAGSQYEVIDSSSWSRDSLRKEKQELLISLPSNIRY